MALWFLISVILAVIMVSCSQQHYTIRGQPCKNSCSYHGKRYTWCWTRTSYDYCTRTSDVTIYWRPCQSICDNRGEAFSWCDASPRGLFGKKWEYCTKESYIQQGSRLNSVTTAATPTRRPPPTTSPQHVNTDEPVDGILIQTETTKTTIIRIAKKVAAGLGSLIGFLIFMYLAYKFYKLRKSKKTAGKAVIPLVMKNKDQELRFGELAVLAENNGKTNVKKSDDSE